MLLRCTHKFLEELGSRKLEVTNFAGAVHPLDEWYAHIFYLQRHKCAMFMNAKTRFSFVVMDIKRLQLKSIEDMFRTGLTRALYEEDYSVEIIKMFSERINSIQLALTIDRSVIGTMNQFIKDFPYIYERFHTGEQLYDGPELGKELRDIPVLKHGFPADNMKKLLSQI